MAKEYFSRGLVSPDAQLLFFHFALPIIVRFSKARNDELRRGEKHSMGAVSSLQAKSLLCALQCGLLEAKTCSRVHILCHFCPGIRLCFWGCSLSVGANPTQLGLKSQQSRRGGAGMRVSQVKNEVFRSSATSFLRVQVHMSKGYATLFAARFVGKPGRTLTVCVRQSGSAEPRKEWEAIFFVHRFGIQSIGSVSIGADPTRLGLKSQQFLGGGMQEPTVTARDDIAVGSAGNRIADDLSKHLVNR